MSGPTKFLSPADLQRVRAEIQEHLARLRKLNTYTKELIRSSREQIDATYKFLRSASPSLDDKE